MFTERNVMRDEKYIRTPTKLPKVYERLYSLCEPEPNTPKCTERQREKRKNERAKIRNGLKFSLSNSECNLPDKFTRQDNSGQLRWDREKEI